MLLAKAGKYDSVTEASGAMKSTGIPMRQVAIIFSGYAVVHPYPAQNKPASF
jgi:hypothetical protein